MFPLSPIPLLIHLGKLISATVPVIVYQYDRDMQQWCLKDPDRKETPVGNQVKVMYSEAESQSLAVTVQVSGTIEKEIVHDAVGTSFHHLDVSIEDPHLTAVLYQQDVEAIKRAFRRELYKLNDIHRYKDIHLFYYDPAGLAIELGRCINDSMLPICIYMNTVTGTETSMKECLVYKRIRSVKADFIKLKLAFIILE